jgi:acyl dehydratase
MAAPVVQPIYFEDLAVGDRLPTREHGPLTIVDTVRWAGLQENWQHLHYDRDHVREHNGLRTFIASGAYRQALLMRLITDWIGPRGMLCKLSIRHTYSTFEGDLMRFGGEVVEKSAAPDDLRLTCTLVGHNQEDREILTGRCTVRLPTRLLRRTQI